MLPARSDLKIGLFPCWLCIDRRWRLRRRVALRGRLLQSYQPYSNKFFKRDWAINTCNDAQAIKKAMCGSSTGGSDEKTLVAGSSYGTERRIPHIPICV